MKKLQQNACLNYCDYNPVAFFAKKKTITIISEFTVVLNCNIARRNFFEMFYSAKYANPS